MWNLKSCNEVCSQRRLAEAQRKHLLNVQQAKPMINDNKPWEPSSSISKNANKYSTSNNKRIFNENQLLLNKMMRIEKKEPYFQSPKEVHRHASSQKSLILSQRRRCQNEIERSNQRLLMRLTSANSLYGRKHWIPELYKNQQYKTNVMKKQNNFNIDYSQKAGELGDKSLMNFGSQKQQFEMRPNTSGQQVRQKYQSDQIPQSLQLNNRQYEDI